MNNDNNIYPIFDRILGREDRERLLKQRSAMIWFTGLSGSGKSTLAVALERELYSRGILCNILDGDNVRNGLNKNLGFSPEDRIENIRRISEMGRLFVDCGVVTISAFISPMESMREMAREIVGADDFIEVFVSTPIEVCEERDVKGLYKKARAGVIKEFTGVSQPIEAPKSPTIEIDTSKLSVAEAMERLLEVILPRIEVK